MFRQTPLQTRGRYKVDPCIKDAMKKQKPEYQKAILSAKKQFIAIAGKEAWTRESAFMLDRCKRVTPELMNVDPESLKQAFLNIAYTGTTLNPMFREAYTIIRDRKCFLDFTYRGLIKLATADGAIISLNANVVYAGDEFECEQGTNARIHFRQNDGTTHEETIRKNPKQIWEYVKWGFSIATFQNGHQEFVVLSNNKLKKTWDETGAKESPINNLWPEEWIRKTAIRYLSKTLPSAKRLVTAVAVLNEHEGISNKKRKPESRLMGRMKK
jgi:recombinational DNA repair protein RecT